MLTYSPQANRGKWDFDTSVKFGCRMGYELVGSVTEGKCSAMGLLNIEETFPVCEKLMCPTDFVTNNQEGTTYVVDGEELSEGDYFEFNDQLTATCKDGYELAGPKQATCRFGDPK